MPSADPYEFGHVEARRAKLEELARHGRGLPDSTTVYGLSWRPTTLGDVRRELRRIDMRRDEHLEARIIEGINRAVQDSKAQVRCRGTVLPIGGYYEFGRGRPHPRPPRRAPLCRACVMQTEWVPMMQAYRCVSPVCGSLVTAEWLARPGLRARARARVARWRVWAAERLYGFADKLDSR